MPPRSIPRAPTDPNYLAILARGLTDANDQSKREEAKRIDDPLIKRRARVLDSLAYILVSHPQRQVVAVGAVLDGPGTALLLVAENDPLPETPEHLEDVVERLRDIRRLEPNLTGSSLPAYLEGTSEVEQKIVELEELVLDHVWDKLSQRFTKDSRHENFLATATAVCGAPASERMDLSVDERRNLARIQVFTDLMQDEGGVPLLLNAVTCLARVVAVGRTTKRRSVERKYLMTVARPCLYAMANFLRPLEKNGLFRAVWDEFTRCRILSKKGAVASGDPTTAGGHLDSQQSPGSDFRIRKMPDLHRWLSKVASICSHFKCIVNAAMSNTLGPMLLNVKVERVSNKFPLPRSEISIDREGVTSVLIAAGHKQDTENDEKVKKLEKDVTDFLRHLCEVYNAEPNEKGEFNVEPKLHTHCECLMLTSGIHDRAKAIPYIGVSKLSCAFCQLYFATYREVTGIQIYTRGTQSQTAPWTFPPFSGPYAVPFESKFVEKMLAKIGEGWAVYRARPLSHASQSTDRSGEDEEPGLSRRLKRAADSAKQRLEDLIRRNPSWSVAVQDQ
ncbi:hypothetical protein DFH09DRAFT_1138481 [Mycena vulgaris]|nr:hypothetical protein DFH09DRAFT_1138481 [Mycena vulgaris]